SKSDASGSRHSTRTQCLNELPLGVRSLLFPAPLRLTLQFNRYIGIDYSGAAPAASNLKEIQVYAATQPFGPLFFCQESLKRARLNNHTVVVPRFTPTAQHSSFKSH